MSISLSTFLETSVLKLWATDGRFSFEGETVIAMLFLEKSSFCVACSKRVVNVFFLAVLFLLRFLVLNEFRAVRFVGNGSLGIVSLRDLRWPPLISVAVRD